MSVLDLRVRLPWLRGRAANPSDRLLVSYTEFTPYALRDVWALFRAATRLRRAVVDLDGAVGVTIYWQLFRRRGGSVSVWEDEAALRRFVALPYHLEIMRRYRTRGRLRAISWEAGTFRLRGAFPQGQRALDAREGRQH